MHNSSSGKSRGTASDAVKVQILRPRPQPQGQPRPVRRTFKANEISPDAKGRPTARAEIKIGSTSDSLAGQV